MVYNLGYFKKFYLSSLSLTFFISKMMITIIQLLSSEFMHILSPASVAVIPV
jgi:hypothetical protein